jgi:hypothetical protein
MVILNEGALRILLEEEIGAVGRSIERRAQATVEQEKKNVIDYFGRAPSLHGRVDQEVGYQMSGSTAVVGIRDGGNKARRLAQKEADGTMRVGLKAALAVAMAAPQIGR